MTNKLATLSRVFAWVAGLSFVITFGGCIACENDQKTEYGEQFHVYKGEVRSYKTRDDSGGEGFVFFLPLIAAGICAISLVGWTQTERKLEEARRKDLQVERELEEVRRKDLEEEWAKEDLEEKRAKRLEKKRAKRET